MTPSSSPTPHSLSSTIPSAVSVIGHHAALEHGEKDSVRGSATVGVPTAVARSMLLQALQFWYRVPIKLFRPMRVDYLVMARAATMGIIPSPVSTVVSSPANTAMKLSRRSQFFRATSIGMLAHAIRIQGPGFFHRQVLPPLIMNSFIGSVLYTTYIFTLPIFHPAFTYQKSRTFPPPPFTAVFMAGALAGAAQSLVAAPMDSLKVKFQVQDLAHGGKHKSMAEFALTTLKELGPRTVYRGFALTLVKDSLACGLFFGVFEWVKQQGYYYFIDELYGIREDMAFLKSKMANDYNTFLETPTSPSGMFSHDQTSSPANPASSPSSSLSSSSLISHSDSEAQSSLTSAQELGMVVAEERPYFLLEPTFVLLAGAAAAVAYQAVDYPLEQVRTIFYAKEAQLQAHQEARSAAQSALPASARTGSASVQGASLAPQLYRMTWTECRSQAHSAGGWRRFLFASFGATAIRAVPAASVGFLVFEVMKRKLDARRYESEDREMASYLDRMMIEREAERRADLQAAMEDDRYDSLEDEQARGYELQELAGSLN